MKLGVEFPESWKEKSRKDEISLSDILYGFAVEDLMKRMERSTFKEYLWLTNEQTLGESAYKKVTKESLEFLYVESEKRSYSEAVVAGKPLDAEVLELLKTELFSDKEADISWECNLGEMGTSVDLLLTGTIMEMHVPVMMRIHVAKLRPQRSKRHQLNLMFEKKSCEYLSFSKESTLSEALFEIMRKLELISDMENYDIVNEIIKSQSISGRHIIEDFKVMGEKEPKVVSMKRLEQVRSYKNYGYMKRRWQQYVRNHKENADSWEEVIERMEKFLTPLWTAFCADEIFFDDWMPELERFFG